MWWRSCGAPLQKTSHSISSLELQSSAQELCFPMSLDGGRRSQPCSRSLNTLQDPRKGWLCPRAEAGHELCLGWLGTGTQLHLH